MPDCPTVSPWPEDFSTPLLLRAAALGRPGAGPEPLWVFQLSLGSQPGGIGVSAQANSELRARRSLAAIQGEWVRKPSRELRGTQPSLPRIIPRSFPGTTPIVQGKTHPRLLWHPHPHPSPKRRRHFILCGVTSLRPLTAQVTGVGDVISSGWRFIYPPSCESPKSHWPAAPSPAWPCSRASSNPTFHIRATTTASSYAKHPISQGDFSS